MGFGRDMTAMESSFRRTLKRVACCLEVTLAWSCRIGALLDVCEGGMAAVQQLCCAELLPLVVGFEAHGCWELLQLYSSRD